MRSTRLDLACLIAAACGCFRIATGAAAESLDVDRASVSSPPPAVVTRWNCGRDSRAVLQILGSGGPLDSRGLASSSYLVWLDSRSKLLVDVGAGAAVNFARARADVRDLDAVLISHIHPDHVSDLPALLWSADVVGRSRPLLVAGPGGSGDFPGIEEFLRRLFGERGAFAFMRRILDPESPFHLAIRSLKIDRFASIPVNRLDGVRISAYPVEHGKTPTVAYRLDGSGFSIVFAGDQTGLTPGFAKFAADADVLVLHTALSPGATTFTKVIGLPQALGRVAARAHVGQVVLAHLMGFPAGDPRAPDFSLFNLESVRSSVASVFHGKVSVASDGECIPLAR